MYSAIRNYNVSYFVKWLANPGLGPHSFWLDVDGIFRNMLSYKGKKKKKTIKRVFNVSLNGKKFTYCKYFDFYLKLMMQDLLDEHM